jgi:TolB protein
MSLEPDWSPDGRHIAFVRRIGRQTDIFVMKPDGSKQRPLTTTEYPSEHDPSWSPDGRRIAFSSNSDGNDAIYVMDADGRRVVKLTTARDGSDVDPDWSPDGRSIVFVSERDGPWQIYVMNVDGSGQRRLVADDQTDMRPAARGSVSSAAMRTRATSISSTPMARTV